MADRNMYQNDVDFAALALQSPAFNEHLKINGQLDFSNPDAVKQLTRSLLGRDFGLRLDLPDDRLCPPVPNRLNYIFWVQDLLDTTSSDYTDQYDASREVVGLDIGTGASCIYPLLGCVQRPEWKFAATDIDSKNMEYAKRNILQNQLKARIRPLQTKPADPLIPLDALSLKSIDFTMCNPPYYISSADLLASAAFKSRPPRSACTGAEVEMVTPGGEVFFISRMIDESKNLGVRCQWYSSKLGKSSSVETVVQKMKDVGIDNWAVKDLMQGSKTKRWAIAWSWGNLRPTETVARSTSTLSKHLLPFKPEYSFSLTQSSIDTCTQLLNTTMHNLEMQWRYNPSIAAGIGFAQGNVWSRAARRKKQQNAENSIPTQTMQDRNLDREPVLGVKIQLRLIREGEITVNIRWLQGHDSVLFESFCGMLKRHFSFP